MIRVEVQRLEELLGTTEIAEVGHQHVVGAEEGEGGTVLRQNFGVLMTIVRM